MLDDHKGYGFTMLPVVGRLGLDTAELLGLHKRDVGTTQRVDRDCGHKDGHPKVMTKFGKDPKVALVLAMGFKSPHVGFVKKAHVFKTQELPVTSMGKFTTKDQVHNVELVNEDGPVAYRGKDEASDIGLAGCK